MKKKNYTVSLLDRLRRFSSISADTSNYDAAKEYNPSDLTTNPTLLLQFLEEGSEKAKSFAKFARAGAFLENKLYECQDEIVKAGGDGRDSTRDSILDSLCNRRARLQAEKAAGRRLSLRAEVSLKRKMIEDDRLRYQFEIEKTLQENIERLNKNQKLAGLVGQDFIDELENDSEIKSQLIKIIENNLSDFMAKESGKDLANELDEQARYFIAATRSDLSRLKVDKVALDKMIKDPKLDSFSQDCGDHFAAMVAIDILSHIKGNVSIEVPAHLSYSKERMVRYADYFMRLLERYAAFKDAENAKNTKNIDISRVYVKIAATWEGIRAAQELESRGIRCNVTLVFSFVQALLCMQASVAIISPFVGRLTDWHKKNGIVKLNTIESLMKIQKNCAEDCLAKLTPAMESYSRSATPEDLSKMMKEGKNVAENAAKEWKSKEEVLIACNKYESFFPVSRFVGFLEEWLYKAKQNIRSLDEASLESLLDMQRSFVRYVLVEGKKFSATAEDFYLCVFAVDCLVAHILQQLKPFFFISNDTGVMLVHRCCLAIKRGFYAQTRILAASFRSVDQILALAGVPIITISLDLLEKISSQGADKGLWLDIADFEDLLPNDFLPDVDKEIFDCEIKKDVAASELLSDGIRRFEEDYQFFIKKINI